MRLISSRALSEYLFRRERGDDFFKARITSQRVPIGKKFQLAITDTTWQSSCSGKLFASEVFVANPCRSHCQILDHDGTVKRILSYRNKFNRVPAFTERFFFSSQCSINQTEHAKSRPVIWLKLHGFLLLGERSSECGSRFFGIIHRTSDNSL